MGLIILDRDGVINEDSDHFIKNADEWVPIPGSIDAIATLSQHGFTLVVASNQSGLGRNLFDLDDLEAMHSKMRQLVENAGGLISGIFYCPHHPDDNCQCRKPKPGLLDAIEEEFQCSVNGQILIGDNLKDLQLARSRSCIPILVKTGKGLSTLQKTEKSDEWKDLLVFSNLAEAANYLLRGKETKR